MARTRRRSAENAARGYGQPAEEEGYCQSVRLADEARKAVSEVMAACPRPDKASQPWEKSRLEYRKGRAHTAGACHPERRDGNKHERIVRYALLRGLRLTRTYYGIIPHES